MSRTAELAESLDRLLGRVAAACRSAGRPLESVQLLPVTKFFPASDVDILYSLGRREFGESREQEAAAKIAAVTTPEPVRWHMIGRLQRNKARAVAGWAHVVHSVDSARLVRALDSATTDALAAGTRAESLHVLLQVSLDGDPERGGVSAADLSALAELVSGTESLALDGLMAIPPLGADPARAYENLADLHSRLLRTHPGATALSAGMSGDLEIAVKYGSTCVRVGTALLGTRPIN